MSIGPAQLLKFFQLVQGRGFSSDIRINDVSVSRVHAEIKLEKGHFYVQDLSSRFGTFILLRDSKNLLEQNKWIRLQIGRSVLEMKVKKVKSRILPTTSKLPK